MGTLDLGSLASGGADVRTMNWERAVVRLGEAERAIAELWAAELPNLSGQRVDDLVVAHRAVRDALRTLRDAEPGHARHRADPRR